MLSGGKFLILKLVVTEKERMAENIAKALGQYTRSVARFGSSRGVKIYKSRDYTILPLSGHIMGYVTPKELERWSHASVDSILSDPKSLRKIVLSRSHSAALRSLSKDASEIIIATDSDEEGENIGLEVLEVLGSSAKPVRRLWLTTTLPEDIRKSFSEMRTFNYDLARSVEARRKVDAIVGFSGSRELTLSLRHKVANGKGVLSFGRVQTSTLWLLVEREREIERFVPKPFWDILAKVKNTTFTHVSSPFFERNEAFETYGKVKDARQFWCSEVLKEEEISYSPRPLNTAEMLRIGSSFLHTSPSNVMRLAENLYLDSLITYPRVDNQTYSHSFSQRKNLEKLADSTNFREYVKSLLSRNLVNPTRGRFSEDHEPITPIRGATSYPKNPLAFRLYELILKHYLAIFGPPAKFLDTIVDGQINGEQFRADGRKLVDKGYYGIYYYAPKERPIDDFAANAKYLVESVSIEERKTEPPPRYTQSTLLAKMEEVGIGTKSTRPTMIETLKNRYYAKLEGKGVLRPTERGMKLIANIEDPWGGYISPDFTARVEKEMEKVAKGEKDWEELVKSERGAFAEALALMRNKKKNSQTNREV
jgi:DNA topoisomerase-1